ncbi:hypothetical protein FACS1894187_20900 [Synergistales bacterium]|nr:hypothetical protein FACS1894187_20900 [Synergistales bacterium]
MSQVDDIAPIALAVVILTFNEEKHIAAAIESALQVTDAIVVIDSGSTDKTIEIAEKYGAKIFYRAWDNDFAAQRNFASDKTEARWLLHLDADERISAALAVSIKKALADDGEGKNIYTFQRLNAVFGQKIRFGAYRPKKIKRLYPRRKAFWRGKVHEKLESELPKKFLPGELTHYALDDWEEHARKSESYSSLWAKEARDRGKKISLFGALLYAFFSFAGSAILRGGFLDGSMGLALCHLSSAHTLTKYLKLWQMQKQNISQPQPGDRVLWMCFGAFGDIIENMANAQVFKRRFPETHLAFLSIPEVTPLLRRQPYLDEVVEGGRRPVGVLWRTLHKIKAGSYQWLINNWHRGLHPYLLNRFSGIPHKIGESPFAFLNGTYELLPEECFRAWNLDIAERTTPALFVEHSDKEEAKSILRDLPERRVFVLIGSSRLKKMWPAQRWVEFLGALLREGWGVVLNGHGPVENEMGRTIEATLRHPHLLNLVDRLDFCQMAAISQACAVTIGNDTGPLHMAAVGGVPSIGLFASSTSRDVGLRMSWFLEVCADTWAKSRGQEISPTNPFALLSLMPAEYVLKQFHSFIRNQKGQ